MPKYDMSINPATWPRPDEDRHEAAYTAYVASGSFTTDALDWVGDHAHRHAALVEVICDYYADSPECASVLEDIADGAREL